MEMEATAESGGSFGEGGGDSGGGRMPGESVEDYIARLKKLGLYGGEISEQPLLGPAPGGGPAATGFGGVATPGSSSGLSAGSNQLSGGLSPGRGSDGGLSGKGMWEPDNSKSGPVGGSYSGGGGGGSYDPGTHKVNALASMLGGGADSGSSMMGFIDKGMGVFNDPIGKPMSQNNLLQLLQFVKPTYQLGPRPAPLAGNPGTNYLSQLMRSR